MKIVLPDLYLSMPLIVLYFAMKPCSYYTVLDKSQSYIQKINFYFLGSVSQFHFNFQVIATIA